MRWSAYLLFLGAGAAAGVVAVVRLSFAGTSVSVPSVVGLNQEQARFQAARVRLRFQVLSERFDLEAPRGQVISQDPPAGSTTRRQRVLGVVISKGVDRMQVPNLIGARMDEAQVKVKQAGLKLSTIAFARGVGEPQRVAAQDPPVDSVVPRESEISILVGLGPEPYQFVTPVLVGKPFAASRASLQQYGVQMGAARVVRDSGEPPDTILSQSPPAGTPLSKRDVVQVSVSRP